jgi:alpha-glucosidase
MTHSNGGRVLFRIAALASLACAAPRAPAQVLPGVNRVGDTLTLAVGRDRLSVQVCRPDMLKVDFRPLGRSSPDTPSIWLTRWPAASATFDIESDPITISTSTLFAEIDRGTGRITVYDASHRLLVAETGVRGGVGGGIDFATAPESHFFGLKGWEFLDDSKGQMEMFPNSIPYEVRAGAEGNTGGPLVWSNQGFGLYVDTDRAHCTIVSPAEVRFSGLSKADVEFYVMAGNAYDIQECVANLTGLAPMFPKWALGFSNSEFADMNEARCLANVNGYRSRGIPFDLYTFDFQWKAWGDDKYGEWRWNPVNFPDGPSGAFKATMSALGVKMAGIMKPRIHVDSIEGRYATDHGFWVPGRKPYEDYFSHRLVNDLDFSKQECREWFWDHAAAAFDTGIVGWWNDEADAWGDTWEFMDMQRALYEGQREHTYGKVRVWSNNRNFYPGAQRYAYATWSGDIESGFTVMQQQRERLMCSLNVGQARWGMDTGGFNNHAHISGDEYSESYARWMEFAAFVPIFRTHGTFYKQPWLFGPRAEAAAKRAIRLRYSLIPYMYHYDRLLNRTGVGICRPLVWDHPDDPACLNEVDAWMFGDSLLVAPVVDRGQSVKRIHLPSGTWIDYFRGGSIAGGRTIDYPVDPSTWLDIPLFIRKGAIIPSIDVMNYVGESPVTQVYVDVFPDAAPTSFSYYDDDGESYDYEHDACFEQVISAQDRGAATRVDVAERTGQYAQALRFYLFRIHGRAGTGVAINGDPAAGYAGYDDLLKGAKEGWASGSDLYGPVTWVKVRAGSVKGIVVSGAGDTR